MNSRELFGVGGRQEKVDVIRQDHREMNHHSIRPLGPAEHAEHGLVDRWSGLEQQATLDRSRGDFYQSAGSGDEAGCRGRETSFII